MSFNYLNFSFLIRLDNPLSSLKIKKMRILISRILDAVAAF